MNDHSPSAPGRPQALRVTEALLAATIDELIGKGYASTTIAAIAARASTSKQAVYRRYGGKAELVAAALKHAFAEIRLAPPERSSVAEDLRRNLQALVSSYCQGRLGLLFKALLPYKAQKELSQVFADLEESQRFALRQIFIATPFEHEMETRIDLLLGLIHYRLLLREADIGDADIEAAIYLVLGLVPPKEPQPSWPLA